MLSNNPRLLRTVASFLLLQTTTQLCWPAVTYALTAGPTAPEATSFEPVDTTDMVNLNSGDFTYNVPLLEVPGPEGGYPLSLAYHAGIQPDVEASWVGLGWGLNPGAIARNVNMYADDQENSNQVSHDYWQGGSTTTYSIGVGTGIGDAASVSAGLTFSQDTYRGFGVGGYAGAGVGIPGTPLGISANAAIDGYGNPSAGLSLNAGVGLGKSNADQGLSLGASVGISTNFQTVSTNAGVGISYHDGDTNYSLLGASISSDGGGRASFRALGASGSIRNDRAGIIQTESNGFNVDIPIPSTPAFVSLGYQYTRYWSDEKSVAAVNGSLYYPKAYLNDAGILDNRAYDTYRVFEPEQEDLLTHNDADWLQGGSFPDYDNYQVSAQGLGGSMRPYSYQTALYSRNRKDQNGVYTIQDAPLSWTNKSVGFRFENDFSNSYRQNNGDMSSSAYSGQSYTFDSNPVYGNQDGNTGYNPTTNRLAGSKHIEWFTNAEILTGNAPGFINTTAPGFSRSAAPGNLIGGFSITNVSGVTYHFALPAYAYNERVYTRKIDDPRTYNIQSKGGKYAYTWFLTAITGPDYVDYNNDKQVNEGDWGYWVGFDYGKWTDEYRWRNPALGMTRDVDASVERFSTGLKEVYYLNSIRTRTHTALFEKSFRADGKGLTHIDYRQYNGWAKNNFFGVVEADTATRSGCGMYDQYCDEVSTKLYFLPAAQLKLNRILLFNNADIPANIHNQSGGYTLNEINETIVDAASNTYNRERQWVSYGKAHGGQNVVDEDDLAQLGSAFLSKAIRVTQFNYDYSLCPGTYNSGDPEGLLYRTRGIVDGFADGWPEIGKMGKLTLKSVEFKGKGGASVMPATRFYYELEKATEKRISADFIRKNNSSGLAELEVLNGVALNPGELYKYTSGNKDYFFVVQEALSGGQANQYQVRILTDIAAAPIGNRVEAVTTKNPPYLPWHTDRWGMFKSDFDMQLNGQVDAIARRTTSVSNKSTDVWCLRKITSALGSAVRINYEGDQFAKPALERPDMITRTALYYTPNGSNYDYWLATNMNIEQARAVFKPGQTLWVNGLTSSITGYCQSGGSTFFSRNYVAVKDVPVLLQDIQVSPHTSGPYVGKAMLRFTRPANSTANYNFMSGSGSSLQPAYICWPKNNAVNEGGGVRVQSISLTNTGTVRTTSYSYNNIYSASQNQHSVPSGVTPYEPGSVPRIDNITYANSNERCDYPPESVIQQYRSNYTRSLPRLLAIARHVPAPGVMYETVSVKESLTRADGSQVELPNFTTYRFEVFKENMLGHRAVMANPSGRLFTSNVTIKDFTSRIGALLSVTQYGTDGKKITETVNRYLHDPLRNASYDDNSSTAATGYPARMAAFNHQGVIQESFADSRSCRAATNVYDHKVVMTKQEVYPSIQTSSTTTDFRTGLSTTQQTLAYDFYSGAPTSTLAIDGYGNRILTEVTPAYRQYAGMGLKVNNVANRHMLVQQAATHVFKLDPAGSKTHVVAANTQTWSTGVTVSGTNPNQPEQKSTQPTIWRPYASFAWMPTGQTANGLTPISQFVGFDFANSSGSAPWRRTNENTLYNIYSNALEAKDINGVFAAIKTGFNHSKILAAGGPARYEEIVYTGAEDEPVGGKFSGGIELVHPSWAVNDATVITDVPSTGKTHTGTRSLQIGGYKHGFSYVVDLSKVDPNKAYRASMWANSPTAQLYYWVDGQELRIVGGSPSRQANGWYLINLDIPAIGAGHSSFRIGCYNSTATPVYVDDFRFQPANSSVLAYVYDKQTGQVSDILDNENLFTHYEYDASGRLKRVQRETLQHGVKTLVEHNQHFAPEPMLLDEVSVSVTVQGRDAQVTFTTPGLQASQRTVSYNAGTGSTDVPVTGSSFTYSYSSPGTYWLKVRFQDATGNKRDVVRKVQIL